MDSRFFNGFLVFSNADSVFERTVENESAFEPLFSLLLFSSILMPISLFLINSFAVYQLHLPLNIIILWTMVLFFFLVLVTAAISGLLDWIYSWTIKIGKQNIQADFLSSFCCHSYVIPAAVFLMAIYLLLPELKQTVYFRVAAVLMLLKLADIEARLLKTVYKLRLIQSYVLLFIQTLLICKTKRFRINIYSNTFNNAGSGYRLFQLLFDGVYKMRIYFLPFYSSYPPVFDCLSRKRLAILGCFC